MKSVSEMVIALMHAWGDLEVTFQWLKIRPKLEEYLEPNVIEEIEKQYFALSE